jgi:carnitine 3-dehydrogenase
MHIQIRRVEPENVERVAVIGTGSVGASWSALFLAHGITVNAYDPGVGAEESARQFVINAWPALRSLGFAKTDAPPLEKLRFYPELASAVSGADVVQENAPERLALKRELLAAIEVAASSHTVIISSTGGIPPSTLQEGMRFPARLVVIHPFNPTHLIPLVEVVGGSQTTTELVDWAMAFSRRLGKHPIRLLKEASGHMTNRLQFALLREAVYCLVEGIASPTDIDAAVRYGLGPRWALMGSLLTLHLAGGPHGMDGILKHAGDAIDCWMTPLTDLHLTPDVRTRMVEAAAEIDSGCSVADWEAWRDANLVRLFSLLQQQPSPKVTS